MTMAAQPPALRRLLHGAPSGAPVPHLAPQTLADRLAARLALQIENGTLAPGDRLPTEARLTLDHGVSRSVVREAVHRLKSRGLLTSRQGSGVFVAPRGSGKPLEFDMALSNSTAAVVQVVEVRRALEIEMASLAAQRATRTQVSALRRALTAIDKAAAAGQDGVAEDLAFHRAIGEATGNPQFSLLLAFLEQYLCDGMRITRGKVADRADLMQAVRTEHLNIVEAIAARDLKAARKAASVHLLHSEMRLQHAGLLPKPAVRSARSSRSARVAPVARGARGA
jgi:GntR family transcriptional regulator, transcriptional repressor for pyruvate dehydrogenase complex